MTTRVLMAGIAALSLFGFAACGGDDKKEDEADASVAADSGLPLNPEDAGQSGGDAGVVDAGDLETDAGDLETDAGPAVECPPETPIALNGECYAEGGDCDETFEEGCSSDGNAVYCDAYGRISVIYCGEGTTCGIAKDAIELDWEGKYAWGVDCMLPCTESGATYTLCGEDDYAGMELEYACSRLEGGGFGAYWHSEETCDHGCDMEENQCILLDPDEGKWCSLDEITDYEGYAEHCTEDGVVVYCNGSEVAVDFCDEGYTCRALKDGSYAGCFNSDDLCTEAGAVSGKGCYVAEDGSEYVSTYICRETDQAGIYVWQVNLDDEANYEACGVNCVPGSSAEEEAHCGLLDERIGQACTSEEAGAGNICGGDGKVTLSCYSDGTERLWHVGINCVSRGETCLTTADGHYAACYGPSTFCNEGDSDTHYCDQTEIFGTTLNISFSYSCTQMSDGSFHQVSSGSDACESTCNEITGLCD